MLFITNWRMWLSFLAICIVVATIFYSSFLANKIAVTEKQKVEEWIEARRFIMYANENDNILLASLILTQQNSIPVIETNEHDSITNYNNLNINSQEQKYHQLEIELKKIKKNPPIVTYLNDDSTKFNKYYYGESLLLKELRYYPLVQLIIVALFIFVTVFAINARHKNLQNQLWTGLAKETAHQLGTPISALHGWIEMLKDTNTSKSMIYEIEKDIDRLQLVSDRFSKIGSNPQTEIKDVGLIIQEVIDYVKKRASQKVHIQLILNDFPRTFIPIASPLFEWVIENLLKNALDAMDEKGEIKISIQQSTHNVIIDVADSGKGMTGLQVSKVFQPGYTTKKRGWGLGLTLCKRIIEDYHKGELIVLHSTIGVGTTFRIILATIKNK